MVALLTAATLTATTPAPAAIYDMTGFLNERHPFDLATPSNAAGASPVSAPARSPDRPPAAPDRTPTAPTAGTSRAPLWGVISELRGGILSHDIDFPDRNEWRTPNPFKHRYEGGVDLNAEVLFVSPGFLRYIGAPRPRFGGSINTQGDTSSAYVDLDWDYQFELGPFIEGFLGLAWHNGKLTDANPDRIEFGSRMLFHLGLEAGWRFQRRHGVSLFWDHMSNAGLLDDKNQGINNFGVRYGYRFD